MTVRKKGFTLLELLLVMAIIAMAAAMIVPRLSTSELTLLRAQAREAVAVLNYAHRTAIVRGIPQVATFYAYSENDENTPTKRLGTWVSKGASLQWGAELKEVKEETTTQQYEITFYPEGGCTGGEFVLSNDHNKIKVTVNPLTSEIKTEGEGTDE